MIFIHSDQAQTDNNDVGAFESSTINAIVNHAKRTEEKPAVIIGGYDATGQGPEGLQFEVTVTDVRPLVSALDLDVNGYAVVKHDTQVEDFYDEDEVHKSYYAEAVRLLTDATGASKVVVFDHTLRKENPEVGRGPVLRAHNDYTEKSGPQRVRDLLPADEAEERLKKRFAIINIWRPINHPVETTPLAIIDATSMEDADFVATDLVYPDRVGEIYNLEHKPRHQWYYVSRQTPEEAILLKTYDSATDGRARWTGHSAIEDPTASADAKPRESIELRALVFFDDE